MMENKRFNKLSFVICLTLGARVLGLSLLPGELNAQGLTKSIAEFGAKAEKGVLNTNSIQQAIDAVSSGGGGTVMIPAGIFTTGAVVLKSGVNLHLQKGAVIEGSDKRPDYDHVPKPALIVAVKQHNISITGEGTIDGKGRELMKDIFKRLEEGSMTDKEWRTKRPAEGTRTNLVYFEECTNVQVRHCLFKDATSWVTHYERCNRVVIDSIRIESVAYWNNDGIDIVDCKNVRITNAYINAADDAICLKSARRGEYCDSVYIADCTLRSSANAFKLGTGSTGGFRNITVRNLTVFDTYRSAIALEAVDGGFLENIDIQHVKATNTGNAIFIKLGHRNQDEVYSRVENISIRDVHVQVPAGKPDAGYEMEGPLLKYPPGIKPEPGKLLSVSPWNHSSRDPEAIVYRHNVFPSSISGLPGHPVKNVLLEDIEITYEGGADKQINYFPVDSFLQITEAVRDYPEFSMFGEVPAWGFFVRHVEGMTFSNVKLFNKKDDYRTAMLCDDVGQLSINTLQVSHKATMPVLLFHDARDLSMKNITLPGNNKQAIKQLRSDQK